MEPALSNHPATPIAGDPINQSDTIEIALIRPVDSQT
jgi:hypothetical protein